MTRLDPEPTLVSNRFDTILRAQKRLDEFTKDHSKGGLMHDGDPLISAWVEERRWTVGHIYAKPVLGELSERYETGGRGSSTVSDGAGDAGGVSYGAFQLSSKMGTARKFVDKYYTDEFSGLKAGTKEFKDEWLKIASEDLDQLYSNEREFIENTHYKSLVDRLKKTIQLDVEARSYSLQDVVWSTSVQHGGSTSLIEIALKPSLKSETAIAELDDAKMIELIYSERGREGENDKLAHFQSSSMKWQPDLEIASSRRRNRHLRILLKSIEFNGRVNETKRYLANCALISFGQSKCSSFRDNTPLVLKQTSSTKGSQMTEAKFKLGKIVATPDGCKPLNDAVWQRVIYFVAMSQVTGVPPASKIPN